MADHDPLAVIHRQIGEALTQIGALKAGLESLDGQSAKDRTQTSETLAGVKQAVDSVSKTLARHAEVLDAVPGLRSQVAELLALLPRRSRTAPTTRPTPAAGGGIWSQATRQHQAPGRTARKPAMKH